MEHDLPAEPDSERAASDEAAPPASERAMDDDRAPSGGSSPGDDRAPGGGSSPASGSSPDGDGTPDSLTPAHREHGNAHRPVDRIGSLLPDRASEDDPERWGDRRDDPDARYLDDVPPHHGG